MHTCPVLCLPGRYAMQAMKHMEPQVKQALQSFPKTVRRKTCTQQVYLQMEV